MHLGTGAAPRHAGDMTHDVQWTVNVDKVTDAVVRSHISRCRPELTLNAFVQSAVQRELDRLAIEEHERAASRPPRTEDMWEIVIPRPRP